jgi:hypothetical protein
MKTVFNSMRAAGVIDRKTCASLNIVAKFNNATEYFSNIIPEITEHVKFHSKQHKAGIPLSICFDDCVYDTNPVIANAVLSVYAINKTINITNLALLTRVFLKKRRDDLMQKYGL